jgi:hypothetical protein
VNKQQTCFKQKAIKYVIGWRQTSNKTSRHALQNQWTTCMKQAPDNISEQAAEKNDSSGRQEGRKQLTNVKTKKH